MEALKYMYEPGEHATVKLVVQCLGLFWRVKVLIFFASGGKISFILLLSLGENTLMHHFTGSTLEAQIQNIILLKHHFFSAIFRLRFYWGIIFVVKVR